MRIIGSYEYRKFLNLFTYLLQVGGIQDGWNRKGLVSETGIKKKAWYELKAYYEAKVVDKE